MRKPRMTHCHVSLSSHVLVLISDLYSLQTIVEQVYGDLPAFVR